MSYISQQQFGDNASISLSNVDGDEGVSKGNLIFGKDKDKKAAIVKIDNGALVVHDMRLHSLVEELLIEMRKISKYLEIMSDEDLIDGDFDKND
jgi:hypothetical protein